MNIWDIIIVLIIGAAVYGAVHLLRKNNGHPCGECNCGCGCENCKKLKK